MDWLTFSLSNQPCFLDTFNTSTHHGGMVVADQGEEDGTNGSSSADMTMLGPKLENFLGGCGEPMGRLAADHDATTGGGGGDDGGGGVYESDLKTIAAGFLRGYPSDPQESDYCKAVIQPEPKKVVDTFGQRTSIYRGVTRHRWTGRYEAHLWDNSCRREGQSRKGRQVYLGGYDKEEKAARAYDLAALKYWGPTTTTNFPVSNYEKEMEEMKNMTRQEFVASLRRKSSGFSRGASIYRGVTRHHQHGRWQARIGRVAGNKDLYLGTFSTQEEAAEAYDIAAIKFRGLNAVTNFDMSRYDVKSIANSNLPIGNGGSGRSSKTSTSDQSPSSSSDTRSRNTTTTAAADFDLAAGGQTSFAYSSVPTQQQQDYWSLLAYHHHQQQQQQTSSNGGGVHNPYFNVFPATTNINMDFSTQSNGTNCYVWNNNGGYTSSGDHQQENEDPYATHVGLGNGGGGYENSENNNNNNNNNNGDGGSWVVTTHQPSSSSSSYPQTGKPNIGNLFQTPIYGIE